MGGPRTTFRQEDGRWTRICSECGQEKDLEQDFYKARKVPKGELGDYQYNCKPCQIRKVNAAKKRKLQDPEQAKATRAKYAAWQRDWRRRHHARDLENRRMQARLQREREGRPLAPRKSSDRGDMPRLPAKPLGELACELASEHSGGMLGLSLELGISDRTLRAWGNGERLTVHYDAADRFLIAVGRLWFEVWGEDEYPLVHEQMGWPSKT